MLGIAAVVASGAVQYHGSTQTSIVSTKEGHGFCGLRGIWIRHFASTRIRAGGGGLDPLGRVSLLGLVCIPWPGREWSDGYSVPCPDQAEKTSVEVVPGKSRKRRWLLLHWHSVGFEWDWDLHLDRQLSICWLLCPGLCFVLWAATGHRWFPHLLSGSSKFIVRRLPDRRA